MGNLFADAWRAIGPERSPLLADLGPEDRSWWRFGLGILLGVLAGLVVTLILALILGVIALVAAIGAGVDPEAIQPFFDRLLAGEIEPTWGLSLAVFGSVAVMNGIMMLTAVWIASLMVKKPLKLSFTTAPRWRWRQLAGGLAIYGVAAAALVAFDVIVGGEELGLPALTLSPTIGHVVVYVAVMVVAAIVAAGAEELVFRGWLLRHSANLMRFAWLYLLINGVLFSAIHLDPDPNAFVARALMGAGFCWMALRFGGIEFATGAHAVNNLLILLLIEPLSLTPPPPEPFSGALLAEVLGMFALMVAATELSIRWRPLARLIGAEPQPRRGIVL